MSSVKDPLVLTAPKRVFQPSAAGGTCNSAASRAVIPLAPRRWRIASPAGDVPGGGYRPGIHFDDFSSEGDI